ncbi:archaetidylserine decarboxylase [Gynuella sunshinyii]|uniref:Phosphatidylserine decarboxylase proenzyme n=1 Tax=Gynuella sunshinyii YC6258 TaxID=1445510 RepID=A0A0C5VLZ8_9GAMM|nr:archaetidylserine decarboxylase [Gynuella sunshinyii]AJQ94388.1 phosphatidylserine decarboxylase [Gynuella sunshinyii YC6258]
MKDRLFIWFQYLAPQHLISRVIGFFADRHVPWLTVRVIRWFAERYQVDLKDAVSADLHSYRTFNEFFTRALKPEARPLAEQNDLWVSPVDGRISQYGDINEGRVVQAKGQTYSVMELLGGDEQLSEQFASGKYMTIYLSPKDYHRIHMPTDGKLENMVFVPGKLFSVNQVTADHVPRLFARNERVVAVFDTPDGKMAMVLVGAMVVASIETVWAGIVAPITRKILRRDYPEKQVTLARGEEMGRFRLGSTVVLLSDNTSTQWSKEFRPNGDIRLGESLLQ